MEFKLKSIEIAGKLEREKKWAEMIDFCSKWSEEEPTNPLAWQGMGDAFRKSDKFDDAVSAYLKAIKVAPHQPIKLFSATLSSGPSWYGLAQAYKELGQLEKAVAAYLEAAKIDPGKAFLWNDLGTAYAIQQDYDNAFGAYKKAHMTDPSDTLALVNLGKLYALGGEQVGIDIIHKKLLALDQNVAREFLDLARKITSK